MLMVSVTLRVELKSCDEVSIFSLNCSNEVVQDQQFFAKKNPQKTKNMKNKKNENIFLAVSLKLNYNFLEQ